MKVKRQTNYFTLVSLIGQYRRGMGKLSTALDYYVDYCENRKIYELEKEFVNVVMDGTDEELAKWLWTYVENAVSYYD